MRFSSITMWNISDNAALPLTPFLKQDDKVHLWCHLLAFTPIAMRDDVVQYIAVHANYGGIWLTPVIIKDVLLQLQNNLHGFWCNDLLLLPYDVSFTKRFDS